MLIASMRIADTETVIVIKCEFLAAFSGYFVTAEKSHNVFESKAITLINFAYLNVFLNYKRGVIFLMRRVFDALKRSCNK